MFKKWLVMCGVVTIFSYVYVDAVELFAADGTVNKEYIKQRVSQEIISQVKQSSAQQSKKSKYMSKGTVRTDGAIYLLPNWPYYTQFFQDNDLIQVAFSFDTASQAYAGRGGSQNLSKLIFGEQPVLIKEILLASKLLDIKKLTSEGQVGNPPHALTPDESRANHYLGILANQEVTFDASLDQYNAFIDYARHFRNGDMAVGIHIPFKMRHQHLRLTNDISDANRTKLENVQRGYDNSQTPPVPLANLENLPELQFYNKFDSLEDFVEEVLSRKGIALNKKETVAGLSDVVAYVNLDIPSRYFGRFVTGVSLLVPTARERDTGKLWYNDLGNGGFVETALFTSLLWQHSRWLNPYVHMKGSYSFAANVYRRIPMTNTYDGVNFNVDTRIGPGQPVHGLIIFGESLKLLSPPADPTFAEPDSTVRGFADQVKKIKIQPGATFFCRVGNTIDALFTYKGFLDLYYDLYVKGKDYISGRHVDDAYVPSLINHNTWVISHTLGLDYSYQFDAQYRIRFGINYAFAGRNTPKTFGAELGFNAEF